MQVFILRIIVVTLISTKVTIRFITELNMSKYAMNNVMLACRDVRIVYPKTREH